MAEVATLAVSSLTLAPSKVRSQEDPLGSIHEVVVQLVVPLTTPVQVAEQPAEASGRLCRCKPSGHVALTAKRFNTPSLARLTLETRQARHNEPQRAAGEPTRPFSGLS
jgi:hypothetical protein